jgi:hypothetical protein
MWYGVPWSSRRKCNKYQGKTRTAVVELRDNEPRLVSSNSARLDDSDAPGMKTIDAELVKWTGGMVSSKSMQSGGNIKVEVVDLQDIESRLAAFNRAWFDDSDTPGIKAIE